MSGTYGDWRWIPIYQRLDPTSPTQTLWAGTTAYAILRDPQHPGTSTTWTNADVRNTYTGTTTAGLGPGVWHAWAKITNSPDTVYVDCGTFVID